MSAFNKNALSHFDTLKVCKARIFEWRIFDSHKIATIGGGGNRSQLKHYKHYLLNTYPYFLQSFLKQQNPNHKHSVAHAEVRYVA